jgi:uncharacterized delta-60 repeat protein
MKNLFFYFLFIVGFLNMLYAKRSVDYNGTPKNKNAEIILSSETSSVLLASYTHLISFDGLPDNTFGSVGVVSGSVVTATASGAALQPDGKIIAVGESSSIVPNFCLVRYNTNGSVDPAFNGGIPVIGVEATARAYAALLQQDGKIVAVGESTIGSFCLARYNSNGSVDPTFNGGNPVIDITDTTFAANAALLQPNGKIVAAGISRTGDFYFCLIRYDSNGSIDPTFNGGNPVIGAITTQGINAVVLQPNGKIVAAGDSQTGFFCLVRYNVDGSVDTTFNGGNPVIDTTGVTQQGHALLLQPDGKIVAVGNSQTGFFCLVRYNSDGSVDPTFNGGVPVIGAITTQVPYAALLQPDGKIISIGQSAAGTFCLARYINPFSLTSFTASYGTVGLL